MLFFFFFFYLKALCSWIVSLYSSYWERFFLIWLCIFLPSSPSLTLRITSWAASAIQWRNSFERLELFFGLPYIFTSTDKWHGCSITMPYKYSVKQIKQKGKGWVHTKNGSPTDATLWPARNSKSFSITVSSTTHCLYKKWWHQCPKKSKQNKNEQTQ